MLHFALAAVDHLGGEIFFECSSKKKFTFCSLYMTYNTFRNLLMKQC